MKVKKTLKIIGIILLIAFILLLIHSIRNFVIIKGLQDNFSKYETSNNYHIKSVAKENADLTMKMNYYRKDNKQVTFIERNTNEEILKVAMYDNGETVDVFTENDKEKTCRINAGNSVMSVEIINYFHTDNDWQTFFMSIFAKIKKDNYNQKECYVIKKRIRPEILYGKDKNELYIEQETGLCIKSIMDSSVVEREYEFDNVQESIFAEPDISQYKLLEG